MPRRLPTAAPHMNKARHAGARRPDRARRNARRRHRDSTIRATVAPGTRRVHGRASLNQAWRALSISIIATNRGAPTRGSPIYATVRLVEIDAAWYRRGTALVGSDRSNT